MLLGRFPVPLTVYAAFSQSNALEFQPCAMFFRYDRQFVEANVAPAFVNNAVCHPIWTLTDVTPACSETGVLQLTFNGDQLSQAVQQDPNHPLYVKMLDHGTLQLDLRMGPAGARANDDEPFVYAAIILELTMVIM